jgi:hypothetical protein
MFYKQKSNCLQVPLAGTDLDSGMSQHNAFPAGDIPVDPSAALLSGVNE